MKVPIGISARHVHLTKEHFEVLFGSDYELKFLKNLSQPGQYAVCETVTIKTDKNKIDNVRILGPIRNYTQIEISKTDAYFLGIDPPVRESGDIKDSSPITLIGPKGSIDLNEGCIIPTRHLHITPEDVEKHNLIGISKLKIMVGTSKKSILYNVSLKISKDYALDLHLDTDDANACLLKNGDIGIVLGEDNE